MGRESGIGIFDSGVGGLTVAREVIDLLPEEDIIYVGDDGRFPYGPRPAAEIEEFALEIAGFLCSRAVKIILVACNTASARALPALTSSFPIPVIGVIEDTARYVVPLTRKKKVGILATPGTVSSMAYPRAFKAVDDQIEIVQVASQALVNLIENGSSTNPGVNGFAAEAIAPFLRAGVDVLVLGCTHYPYLTKLMTELMADQAIIVDPAIAVSRRLKRELEQRQLLRQSGSEGKRIFYTTGEPSLFLRVGRQIYPRLNEVNELRLDDDK